MLKLEKKSPSPKGYYIVESSRQTLQGLNISDSIPAHTEVLHAHMQYICNLSKQPGRQFHNTVKHQFNVPLFKVFPLLTFSIFILVYKFPAFQTNLTWWFHCTLKASPNAIKKKKKLSNLNFRMS